MKTITQEQIDRLISTGDIPEDIRNAGERVLVILTQDWCHQWQDMKAYLPEFEGQVEIFTLEYNLHPEFQKIMGFKEQTYNNYEVPYLRYYHKGEFITETNWIPKGTFAALLKREKAFSLKN